MSKFAYFGTPYVARDTLAYLLEHGYRPEVVVTSPDAPRGRGLVLTPSETRVLAEESGIPVLTPQKLTDEAIEEIRAYGCDYAIVVAYGKILPERLIEMFPKGVLNVHYSLLPKYRGASPVEAALLNGDQVTGVTIQRMVYALDAGDIVAQETTDILPDETTKELRPRLVSLGAALLVSTLPGYLTGSIPLTPQDESRATHSGKIKKEEGELILPGNDELNWRKYRAYAEGPGTYFFKDGKRIKIVSAAFENGTFTPLRVIPEGKKETDYASLV